MFRSLFQIIADLRQNLRGGARLAFLRPLNEALCVSPGQVVALVLLYLATTLLVSVAYGGLNGYLNFYALPSAVFFVPLLFLFAFIVARRNGHPSLVLLIPVAFISADIAVNLIYGVLELTIKNIKPGLLPHYTQQIIYFSYFVWWILIALVFLYRYARPRLTKQKTSAFRHLQPLFYNLLFILIILAPSYWLPRNDLWVASASPDTRPQYEASIAKEENFHAQAALFSDGLNALAPERPGITDLYFVGFAAYANEDVFMKELRVIERLFKDRFDTATRSISLINHPQTAKDTPIATVTHLAMVLHRLGKIINADEDIVFLYLTSHGSKQHELSVDFWPLQLNTITPAGLKKMFDDAAIKWRVVVISACYSGGYVEPLKDAHTLIMTASDPQQTSFGCGSESDFTYFGKAVFDEELRRTHSFTKAFDQAKISILKREKAEGFDPSNPQIFVGDEMRDKLLELETRLSQTHGIALHEQKIQ